MTWFHASLQAIKRSENRSAVACVAYRIGACMDDLLYERERDYTQKRDVVASFTIIPPGAPEWMKDPESLWNAAQVREDRINSQLAWEWEIALPHTVPPAEREVIARNISQWLVDTYSVAVTTGIHRGAAYGGYLNDHMHLMIRVGR